MHEWGWFLLGLLIVILVIVTLIRRRGRRRTEKQIIESQQLVNSALRVAVQSLEPFKVTMPTDLTTEIVANIWGHNVMAFELILENEGRADLQQVTSNLDQALSDYAKAHGLRAFGMQKEPLLVTDAWYDNVQGDLHLDIAHVTNAQTLAYLRDLARLNQPAF